MSESTVLLELSERDEAAQLATLTVSNPRRLNALDSGLLADFEERIQEVEAAQELRVVVLQGSGDRAFIGGADVNELAELDAESARRYITSVHRVCEGLRALPVPVIARIQGYCLGAGLEIAASCDLRVATEQSQFGMPEVQLGVPSVIEAALLPQLVGWGRTRELLFGGQSFMAREVAGWGLIERVHQRGDRREYFLADADVWRMFETITRERRRREVEPIIETIEKCRELLTKDLKNAKGERRRCCRCYIFTIRQQSIQLIRGSIRCVKCKDSLCPRGWCCTCKFKNI